MRHLRTALVGAFIVILGPDVAQAADGQPTNWFDLLWRTVTTAAVIFVIWKLAGVKIVDFFSGRRKGIATELADLENAREKARADLLAVEKRIANLESERKAIIAEYTARGEAIKAEIIARAEKAAGQITAQAQATARNEVEKSLAAMRANIAEEIAAAAEKALAERLAAKDHEKLLDNVLKKVVLQ